MEVLLYVSSFAQNVKLYFEWSSLSTKGLYMMSLIFFLFCDQPRFDFHEIIYKGMIYGRNFSSFAHFE